MQPTSLGTPEILDKVASHGETVSVERNKTLIAQIIQPRRIMTAAQALAGLALPPLSAARAAAWLKNSKGDFDDAVRDLWAQFLIAVSGSKLQPIKIYFDNRS